MAQAAAAKPLELSRYCVPFTPFQGRLEDVAVCLVSTASVWTKDDEPFRAEDDVSWRVIPGDVEAKDLRCDDTRYDHACVDRDMNCVFPIDRVRELAREGRVGGLTARHFFARPQPGAPRASGADHPRAGPRGGPRAAGGALLTGGWRLCHRTVVTVQRAIEMIGIPTVVVTVEPEETRQARPPRALAPHGFVAGHTLGRPGDAALHKWVLMDGLGLLVGAPRPGEVIDRDCTST